MYYTNARAISLAKLQTTATHTHKDYCNSNHGVNYVKMAIIAQDTSFFPYRNGWTWVTKAAVTNSGQRQNTRTSSNNNNQKS